MATLSLIFSSMTSAFTALIGVFFLQFDLSLAFAMYVTGAMIGTIALVVLFTRDDDINLKF
ncbi:MAG: hypothetical protein AAGA12_11845 [Pseudomonadota bacterium]